MRFAHRFSGPGGRYDGLTKLTKRGPEWTGKVVLVPEMLEEPTRWRKPCRIFVNSMSDLFHESLSNEEIAAVFGVMASAPRHTFQVLTKRADRMRDWFRWVESVEHVPPVHVCEIEAANRCDVDQLAPAWPLRNVWLGVSVEDQRRADERIPLLLDTPAAVRFLSCEPLLEAVNIGAYLVPPEPDLGGMGGGSALEDHMRATWRATYAGRRGVDWCVVGGESGYSARPFDLSWARSLRDQCAQTRTAFFMKQVGAKAGEGAFRYPTIDRAGSDPIEWPADLRVQEFPT